MKIEMTRKKGLRKFLMLLLLCVASSAWQACGDDEVDQPIGNPNEEATKPSDDNNKEDTEPDDANKEDGPKYEYEYYAVDLGLSVKWATCNVGAYRPEHCGSYFAWGEISEKSEYTQQNSLTRGKKLFDISGYIQYDAARANWGGEWRMPTYAECQELKDKCSWIITTKGGNKGFEVKGPSGNTIFLPCTGRKCDNWHTLMSMGFYWCSTPYDTYKSAYTLCFTTSDDYIVHDDDTRETGHCVRPVVNKNVR